MKPTHVVRVLLTLCACLYVGPVVQATTLQVKVTDVQTGNTIVVTNTNRPLRVRLKAITPPDPGQPFSDTAREHLRALVMDRAVTIEYSDLSDGFLQARVILNQIDIASQMLRDGAAWYDRTGEYALSESDREFYARCEQAAREEKRGLWSDAKPVSPWDFRKSKQVGATTVTSTSLSTFRATEKPATATKTLSNRYFAGGDVEPGSIAGQPTFKLIAPNAAPDEWTTYRSDSPRFSIRVPGNSFFYQFPIVDDDLKIVNLNYVAGSNDGSVFVMMWTKGSGGNATDANVADATVQGLIKGINTYFERKALGITATSSSGHAVRIGGYGGKQYTLSAGVLSGFARIVSKRIGDQREIFALAVFTAPGDESGSTFLDSLKLVEAKK